MKSLLAKGALLTGALLLSLSLCSPAFAAGEPRPQLESLTLDREEAAPGGRILLEGQAWAGDGEMGPIQLFFQNSQTGRVLMGVLRETRDPGGDGPPPSAASFSGTLAIPGDASPGEYRLIRVLLRDSAGGSLRLENSSSKREGVEPLDFDLSFRVEEGTAAPAQPSSTLTPSSAKAGDTLRFQVTSPDEEPLLTVSSIFRERGGDHSFPCSLSRRDSWADDHTLEGEITLPEHLPAGQYDLSSLTVTTLSGARQTYSAQSGKDLLPLTNPCSVTVSGGGDDRTGPVLESIAIGDPYQDDGDQIIPVTLTARDDGSGIDHITVRFENDQKDSVSTVLYGNDDREGTFRGEITVGPGDGGGLFTLQRVTLADRAGNRVYYAPPQDCRDGYLPLPQTPSFQTALSSGDDTPPCLLSVTLEEHRIQPGEAIRVTGEGSDDQTGVDEIQLEFREEGGKSVSVTLSRDRDGELSGWVKKYQTKTPGHYRLTRAVITDLAGNRFTYRDEPRKGEGALPFSAGFTVKE